MTVLEFDGIPFDPVTVPGAAAPAPVAAAPAAAPAAPAHLPATAAAAPTVPGGQLGGTPLAQLRAGIVAAHRAALTAQIALQRAAWQAAMSGAAAAPLDGEIVGAPVGPGALSIAADDAAGAPGAAAADARVPAAPEDAFKPLARTGVTQLDAAALTQLTHDAGAVFGPRYAGARLTGPLLLTEVVAIELRGGNGKGRIAVRYTGDAVAAAAQAAELFGIYVGMHRCFTDATATATASGSHGNGVIDLEVTSIDLVPQPHVRATDGNLTVTVTFDGTPRGFMNEYHMVQLARGDQGVAMGPEFAHYTGIRATRLPTGGLLLVDRVTRFDGKRGNFESASYDSEYDSPADSWYYADTANESMPHFVYMETSLQAALLMGYWVGPTLTDPHTTQSLRNLGGSATVLRQIDLRDKTIQQASRLLSTTILPGSSLQTFDYTLSVDGEPFYVGETMFGYFSDQALGNQTGLDAGRSVPSWLAENSSVATRAIDVAARRNDPQAVLCSRRTLTLIDRVTVVDGGGKYGAGYLHSLRDINPQDWFFARHFYLDPVIPGSLGVESVIHAIQEWIVDAGYSNTLADPVFRIPAGIEFSWRYRGQFLPTDGTVELEVHLKSVRRTEHGVVVVADGSLWKPGLRIYELIDIAVELTERGAPSAAVAAGSAS